MSELIDNREHRQRMLKELIMELHDGKSVEDVQSRFAKVIEGITTAEIAEMEQNLIMEGMPVEEVQRLCDVHAAVFKGSIEDIHRQLPLVEIEGHPLNTFTIENEALTELADKIEKRLEKFMDSEDMDAKYGLLQNINELWDIDKHYSRKENLLFPYLEKYGITAPPKVMWGVDDEIREQIKLSRQLLTDDSAGKEKIKKTIDDMISGVKEMVFKEKNILFPMATEHLTEDEWLAIERESHEIGYCLVEPKGRWMPERSSMEADVEIGEEDGSIRFGAGILTFTQVEALLNTLPIDMTFIDSDDIVRYFSQGKHRLFTRTKAVLGRSVQNCHPPASVNIVDKILDDFKSGAKDEEAFWIEMGDVYAYIRYFAVRDRGGEYLGTLEVTQDIRPIQKIEGEKRLLSN
ncbi:MAG: DUF438 domain-containing protein [Clostridiales bacterium]|nr:DUF438 domain-containing protein [Clostridiales bacterium]